MVLLGLELLVQIRYKGFKEALAILFKEYFKVADEHLVGIQELTNITLLKLSRAWCTLLLKWLILITDLLRIERILVEKILLALKRVVLLEIVIGIIMILITFLVNLHLKICIIFRNLIRVLNFLLFLV